MAQQTLGLGSNANDGNGDTLRVAMDKVNDNFGEIYASPLFTEDLVISGNEIRANRTNDDLVFKPSGTGSISFPAIRINDNNIEGTRSNDNINLVPNGTGSVIVGNLSIRDNKILSNASNADIELTPSGTGKVTVPQLTVDSNINIKDNEIKTTQSNSDLVLEPSGTGSVKMDKVDINGGTIDNTVIGATTPLAGTFTTLTANTSAVIDGITITDNTISSNASNAELELTGNGSGTVSFNGLKFPIADGTNGQVLKTDGNGNLGFATASAALTLSAINDGTVTHADSSTNVIDTFATATYRSAKYFISMSDAANSRFELVEINMVHGPSADSTTEAFLSVFGSTTNHTTPLATFTADIDDGNVRLLATNITSDTTVFKFQRVMIDL
tara:strand:- start:3531 stop:4688 length:1158 start_codon:yes stop_codon:yes gene_type:complete